MAADTALAIITLALWWVADRTGEPLKTLFFAVGILTMIATFLVIAYPESATGFMQGLIIAGTSIFFLVIALVLVLRTLPQVIEWLREATRK